jgi:hypothetical protein
MAIYYTICQSFLFSYVVFAHLEHHTVVNCEDSSKMDANTQFLCEQCGVCPLAHLQHVAVCERWRDNPS